MPCCSTGLTNVRQDKQPDHGSPADSCLLDRGCGGAELDTFFVFQILIKPQMNERRGDELKGAHALLNNFHIFLTKLSSFKPRIIAAGCVAGWLDARDDDPELIFNNNQPHIPAVESE